MKDFECKRLFIDSFANPNYPVVGLCNVQNVVIKVTIYVCFVQKFFLYFFVYWIKIAQAGKVLFGRHWQINIENSL